MVAQKKKTVSVMVTLFPEHNEYLRALGHGKLSEGIRVLIALQTAAPATKQHVGSSAKSKARPEDIFSHLDAYDRYMIDTMRTQLATNSRQVHPDEPAAFGFTIEQLRATIQPGRVYNNYDLDDSAFETNLSAEQPKPQPSSTTDLGG